MTNEQLWEKIKNRYEKLRSRMRDIQDKLSGISTQITLAEQRVERTIEAHTAEPLARILEILEAGPQPNAQFFWPADKEKLDVELAIFAKISVVHDDRAFRQQTPDMQVACNAFQDYLVDKYDDVELVNDQGPRHAHEVPDRSKHADALVILVNPADPSEDLVVDFCWGSSEPGTLYSKLQFLVHPERRPYPWWVDNNFPSPPPIPVHPRYKLEGGE